MKLFVGRGDRQQATLLPACLDAYALQPCGTHFAAEKNDKVAALLTSLRRCSVPSYPSLPGRGLHMDCRSSHRPHNDCSLSR